MNDGCRATARWYEQKAGQRIEQQFGVRCLETETAGKQNGIAPCATRNIRLRPIERRQSVFGREAFVVGQNVGWCIGEKKTVAGGKPMMGFVTKVDPAIASDDRAELQGGFCREPIRPMAARLEPRATRSANVQE